MTDISHGAAMAPARAFSARWFHHIPVLGWILRDLQKDFHGNIWFFITLVVSLLGMAVLTWGLPALGLVALACVPCMFVVLILITLG